MTTGKKTFRFAVISIVLLIIFIATIHYSAEYFPNGYKITMFGIAGWQIGSWMSKFSRWLMDMD